MSIQCGFMEGVLKRVNSLQIKTLARLFMLLSMSMLAMPWPALALTATTLGDYDNITVMQVSGNYDVAYINGNPDMSARRTIAKEFYRTHGDDYDMLVIFTNFDFVMPPAAKAFYSPARNDIRGIGVQLAGQELFDYTNAYSPTDTYLTRLNGTIDMASIASHVMEPTDPEFDDTLMTLTHEFLHRWGAYVHFMDGTVESNALLGSADAHWSFLLDSGGSTLYGNNWRDNGDGTFTAIAPEQARAGELTGRIFSPLDLYLMGLIDKTQVPPLLLIDAPGVDRTRLPAIGETIAGMARTVTIDDIVAAEGERTPSAANSRKEFQLAFIYAVTPGTWSAGDAQDRGEVAAINRVQLEWEKRFSILTDGVALMRTAFVIPEPRDTNPGVPTPTDPPAVAPSVNNGISWLISRQQPGGFWRDQPGTEQRDTAAAVAALKLFPAGTGAAANGQAWLGMVTPENSDFLARKLLGLNSASIVDIISRQNADGGWGSAPGYNSNPVDTALVLQVLATYGGAGSGVLTAAVNYLHGKQSPDGGWNAGRGGSMVQPTARALLALNSQRGSYPLEPVIADGLVWLTARQNGDGGFGNSPSTVIDTALALEAIKAAGSSPTAAGNAVNYLLAKQTSAGSWGNSAFQTAQAVEALYAGQVAVDLVVEPADISINPSMVTTIPSTATVTVVARNLGSNPVAAVKVALYDNDPVLANLLGEQTVTIPGNGSALAIFSVTVTSAGLHEYYASVDGNRQVAEANEWNNTASKTLTANMEPPTVGFAQASSVGSEAVAAVPLAVTLSYPWPEPIAVNFAVNATSTATPSADYTLASGTLTFAADETSKPINLTVVNDLVAETDESVVVDLSTPSLGTLGTSRHSYIIRDDESPAVTLTSPPMGIIGQSSPQLLYATTGGNVVVKVDGVVVAKVSGNTLDALADGAHFVEVSANNSYGLVTTKRVDFIVDTMLPTIIIHSPVSGITSDNTPLLDYVTTSAVREEVWVDGTQIAKAAGESLAQLADGTHTLIVKAWNAAGSMASSQVSFSVDTQAPTIGILYPYAEVIRENNPMLFCNVSEAGTATIWVDDVQIPAQIGGSIGPLADGPHKVKVQVVDNAGLIAIAEAEFIVYTGTEPAYLKQPTKNIDKYMGAVASDRFGNFYLVVQNNNYQFVVYKYNAEGSLVGTSGTFGSQTYPEDIAVDSLGNVFVTGWTFGGSVPGIPNSWPGMQDGFVSKLNPDLTYATGINFGTTASDFADGVVIDKNNYVYVAGYTGGGLFGSPNGTMDFYVAKLPNSLTSIAGSLSMFDGKQELASNSMTMDNYGYIYVLGKTDASVFWKTHKGGEDYFVAKFTSGLTATPVILQDGSLGNDQANGVGVDAYGNIYVSGYYKDPANSSIEDKFIAKYSPQGEMLDRKFLGYDSFEGMDVADDGTVYLIDGYGAVYKYSSNLAFLWSIDASAGSIDQDIVLSDSGDVVAAGENGLYGNVELVQIKDSRRPVLTIEASISYTNQPTALVRGAVDVGSTLILRANNPSVTGTFEWLSPGQWQLNVVGLEPGDNAFEVEAVNPAGFRSKTGGKVVLDTVAPIVTIISPVQGQSYSQKPLLNYTVSEACEVAIYLNSVRVVVENGYPIDSLQPGGNTLLVMATDLSGNVGYAQASITVTATAATGPYPPAYQRTEQFGSAEAESASDSVRSAAGDIHVVGSTRGSLPGFVNAGENDIMVARFDSSGHLLNWRMYGTANDETSPRIATDQTGNYYLSYVERAIVKGKTVYRLIVKKFNQDWEQQWIAPVIAASAATSIGSLFVDRENNSYVAGSTDGSLDGKRNGGNSDYFVIKYDANGNKIWSRLSGEACTDKINKIVVDSVGRIYALGEAARDYYNTASIAGHAITNGPFILILDANGLVTTVKPITVLNTTVYTVGYGSGLDIDSAGRVYYAGAVRDHLYNKYFVGFVDLFLGEEDMTSFNSESSVFITDLAVDADRSFFVTGSADWFFDGNQSRGANDVVVAKFNEQLMKKWSFQDGTPADDYGNTIVLDGNGHLFVAGGTKGALGTSYGQEDLFLMTFAPPTPLTGPVLNIDPVATPTRNTSQVVSGIMSLPAVANVKVDAPAGSTATVSPVTQYPGGTWSFTVGNLAANADNVLTVSATDIFGTTSKTVTIAVDTLPPALTISPVTSPTNANIQTVAGTIETGATLSVEVNPPTAAMPVTVTNSVWNYQASLMPGDNLLVLTATDAVGNTTVSTATITCLPPKLMVSPTSIAQGEPAAVTLTIGQFDPASPDVRIETIRDVGGDGSPTNDPLIRLFSVRDGVVSNNPNLPGDEDGQANGRIVTTLRFDYLNDVQMASGDYLIMANTSPTVAVASFRVTESGQTQTIQGYVIDLQNTPLSGASVQLLDKWGRNHGYAFTDSAGHYLLSVPKPGEYVLLPTVENFVFAKANLTPHTLSVGQHLSVDLPMLAGTYQVEGQVRESGTTLQVPGGVLVRAENDQYVAAPMTRVYGAYQLDLPAGDYDLFADAISSQGASALGYLGSRGPLTRVKVSAASTDNHLSLSKGNTLVCGRVVDPANLGVAGLVIEAATDSGSGRFATAVSDSNGNYCLGLIDEGSWRIALNAAADQPLGYVGKAVSGIMAGNGPLSGIDLAVFPIESVIEGVVSEDGAQPVAGMTVTAVCVASGAVVTGRTATDGSYRLGVHAGIWQVAIAAEALGYNPLDPLLITAPTSSSVGWNFVVTKPAPSVSVTVDPVVSPTTQPSQTLRGSRSTNATLTVAVDTAATVGVVDYPTATTWQCTINNLIQGPNVVTVSVTDGATQFTAPVATIDYQPLQMVNTITITKATYDTRKKVLNIEAASNYDNAQLQVVGYGPMTFVNLFKGKYYWSFSQGLPTKPATVTVLGPEGSQTVTLR